MRRPNAGNWCGSYVSIGEPRALRVVNDSIEDPDCPSMGIEFSIEVAKARPAPEDAAFFD
jgi:hypothetical protein